LFTGLQETYLIAAEAAYLLGKLPEAVAIN
jgi:hypothetical protein